MFYTARSSKVWYKWLVKEEDDMVSENEFKIEDEGVSASKRVPAVVVEFQPSRYLWDIFAWNQYQDVQKEHYTN